MIDKSVRQYYANGQLVKPTRHGLRPGYRGKDRHPHPGIASTYSAPAPTSGGNQNTGKEKDSHPHPGIASTYSAPAPAPAPDYSSLDNEEQQAVDRGEPTAQMTPKERNEQGHGPGGTNNQDYKQKQYEITGDIDELHIDSTGFDDSPKVNVADIHGEWDDPDSVSWDPTYNPVKQAEATRKAIAEYKPPFFDTGPGKFLKNVGLGIVAPQLLAATPLAKPYSMWRTANTVSNLAERFGFNKPKDVMQTLTSNLTTPNKTGITTLPPPREGEGKEQYKKEFTTTAPKDVITAPKDVITESVQKFSPKQLDLLQQRYAELNKVIESGEYMGQKLNDIQLNKLTQTSNQMKDFLVSEVGGMRLT
jgi:hypothetical protein